MAQEVHKSAITGKFASEAAAEAAPDEHFKQTVFPRKVLEQAAINYHRLWRTFLSEIGNGTFKRKEVEDNIREVFQALDLELPSDLR